MPKVAPILYGERKVFTVSSFNRGVGMFLGRLPAVWVEGEVTELRRSDAWANVFVTLKDPATGATLNVTIARRTYDRLALALEEGETVHVAGRAELYEQKGELGLRATTIERLGVGAHLLALEQLKQRLAAEGLFAPERKRSLPRLPRAVGILTGADAAARGDLVATIGSRFPGAQLVVCETRVQGKGAPRAIAASLRALTEHPEVDVVVLARGGGSFEDLMPFSDELVVRAVASARVPVVSAVGHEQDTPLCDLAADVRAATPTAAGALVVPDLRELEATLAASRRRLGLAIRARLERDTRAPPPGRGAPARGAAAPRRAQARGARPLGRAPHRPLATRDPEPWLRDRPRRGRRAQGRVLGARGRPARRPAGSRRARRHGRRGARVTDASFEELQRELDEIVARLERGDVPVDEAIALFRRGQELYAACVARLESAELRIEELTPPGDAS